MSLLSAWYISLDSTFNALGKFAKCKSWRTTNLQGRQIIDISVNGHLVICKYTVYREKWY